jgi:hypothetical protein
MKVPRLHQDITNDSKPCPDQSATFAKKKLHLTTEVMNVQLYFIIKRRLINGWHT